MKTLFTLLIVFFCSFTTYARCGSSGLWVFPSGKTIKQNPVFVIEGYGESQKIILELNKKNAVYLKTGDQKIKLIVTETLVGQFQLTQAVLKPESKLKEGLEYTLHIDKLYQFDPILKYNKTSGKNEKATYTVTKGKDLQKPEVSTTPQLLEKTLKEYGCGPAKHMIFSNPVKDDADIIVKTTLKNLATGKEITYYITPDGEQIKVGNDMCHGAFVLADNTLYSAEFSFMDSSGNLTKHKGESIIFTTPVPQTDLSGK